MVVVPHRPLYKAWIFCLFLVAMVAFSLLTYEYGMNQGLETKVEVLKEKEEIQTQLEDSRRQMTEMRQELADLKLGGEIDTRANEEVRQTVEGLQDQIAGFREEIRFYKGVMLPNVEEKGLRIERLNVENTGEPNKYKYSLLLTQVVDKHDFVQGGVEIALLGSEGSSEKQLALSELSEMNEEKLARIRFRFRYFQNIDGELSVPVGFKPREIMIIAKSSGRNGQRLEKKFAWQLNGG
ncbi:MAG: hypothetical protein CMQ20_16835 [Gammaproteobacteria bacterium]|nr:hypothetical protein [Gammaproteobacteria bacterium]